MNLDEKLKIEVYVYPIGTYFYVSIIPVIDPIFWEDTRINYSGFELSRLPKLRDPESFYCINSLFKRPTDKLRNKPYFLSSTIPTSSLSNSQWFCHRLIKFMNDNVGIKNMMLDRKLGCRTFSSIASLVNLIEYTSLRPTLQVLYSPNSKYLNSTFELDITIREFLGVESYIINNTISSLINSENRFKLLKRWGNHLNSLLCKYSL